jgi:hypothetical protein
MKTETEIPEGTLMTEIPEGQIPFICCGGIHPKLKEYLVMTTHECVEDTIREAREDTPTLVRATYVGTLRNLTKYSEEELNAEYELKSQKWQDFCDDALLFYVARLLLMGKEIPIKLMNSTEGMNIH